MRYFLLAFSIPVLACSDDSPRDARSDSLLLDSIKNAIQYEKFDSIPSQNMELWRKEGEGTFYAVELRYTDENGKLQRVPLLDTFPAYLYFHRNGEFESTQLTGYGSNEILIRFGGSWGMGSQFGVAHQEDLECFFVVDMKNGSLLQRGCSLYHYEQMVEDFISDSVAGPFKVGYDYKVHAKSGEIVIDSLNYFGDSIDGPPDHLPGRYQWKNAQFVRM